MTFIQHQGSVGTISAYEYTYDGNGNRLTQIETNAGRTEETTYTYDPVNRLETVAYPSETTFPNGRDVVYAYDLAGNRETETETDPVTTATLKDLIYDYDAINRLDTITDNLDPAQNVTYQYDANGNTLSKTKAGVETTFHYDVRDQLGEVRQDSSILGRYGYGYDYDRRRILKIGADGRRHYTYDQLSVITEADEDGVTVSKYDYGLDQLVSLDNRSEGRSFFHLDLLGSTVSLTDPLGTARQSIIYDAWGNERDRVGSSENKFTFTGHEKDEETGLIYAKARFYDSDIGRFLTQDPFAGRPELPPSLHRYIYVGARPTVKIDPLGLYEEDVHRGLTEFLASVAGFSLEDARDLGQFAQGIDEDPSTAPIANGVEIEARKQLIARTGMDIGDVSAQLGVEIDRPMSELQQVLTEWHFPKEPGEKTTRRASKAASARVDEGINLAEAATIVGGQHMSAVHKDALRRFGRGLHPLEDSFAHEGGDFQHPFRGQIGDTDFSSPTRHFTDQTHTTPEKSQEMARTILRKMLEFRRARGDQNVPSEEQAWQSIRKEVGEFIRADTRSVKERILGRWGVSPGEDQKWDMSLTDPEKPIVTDDGYWGKVHRFLEERRRRIKRSIGSGKEASQRKGEDLIRERKELEEKAAQEELLRQRAEEQKRKAIVIPERPNEN